MLRSNSKKAKQNIVNYIRDYSEDRLLEHGLSETDIKNDKLLCTGVYSIFYDEMVKYDNRYKAGRISLEQLFFDWAQGLAMNGLFCYYCNRSAVDDIGEILEETDEEKSKYSEEAAEKMLTKLIFREVCKNANA